MFLLCPGHDRYCCHCIAVDSCTPCYDAATNRKKKRRKGKREAANNISNSRDNWSQGTDLLQLLPSFASHRVSPLTGSLGTQSKAESYNATPPALWKPTREGVYLQHRWLPQAARRSACSEVADELACASRPPLGIPHSCRHIIPPVPPYAKTTAGEHLDCPDSPRWPSLFTFRAFQAAWLFVRYASLQFHRPIAAKTLVLLPAHA